MEHAAPFGADLHMVAHAAAARQAAAARGSAAARQAMAMNVGQDAGDEDEVICRRSTPRRSST